MKMLVCRVCRSRYKFKSDRRKRAQFGKLDVLRAARLVYELSGLALVLLSGFALFFTAANWTAELFICTKCLVNFAAIGSLVTNSLN